METIINTNDTLTVRFVTDSDLRPLIKVLSRKGNFVTVKLSENEIVRKKVYSYNNEEFIFPYGKYSMAPIAKK